MKRSQEMKKLLVILVVVISLVIVSIAIAQDYPAGMIHYWKFDDVIGTNATDSVGSNDGSLIPLPYGDGPMWVTGKVNGALNFDGVNDRVDGEATVSAYGDFSMCAWFRIDEMPQGYKFIFKTALGQIYLYAEENGQVPMGFVVHEYRNGNQDNIEYQWDYWKQVVTNIQPGEWHFVVMTADDMDPNDMTDDECKAYLDGELIDILEWKHSGIHPEENHEFTVIGASKATYYGTPSIWAWFDGEIDEVAVFDKVLTLEEIQQFYQNGLDGLGYGEAPVAEFSCYGFEPPMAAGPVTVKKNRALPHKAQLLDVDGYAVTDADIAAPPVIQVLFDSGSGGDPIDVTDDALPAGQGTEGNQFVYTEDEKWQFNLKTKNYTASGTYTVTMETGDEAEYLIDPTCESSFVIK
jgi:hypothetical protein